MKHRIQFDVTVKQRTWLDGLAAKLGCPRTEMLRRALRLLEGALKADRVLFEYHEKKAGKTSKRREAVLP